MKKIILIIVVVAIFFSYMKIVSMKKEYVLNRKVAICKFVSFVETKNSQSIFCNFKSEDGVEHSASMPATNFIDKFFF